MKESQRKHTGEKENIHNHKAKKTENKCSDYEKFQE
jgi:hypothetical protein